MARQIIGRNLAHMADAEGENHPAKANAPPLVDRVKKICRALLAPALSVLELFQARAEFRFEIKYIGGFLNPTIGIEGLDLLGAPNPRCRTPRG